MNAPYPTETAADLAAAAAFLEMAEDLGISTLLDSADGFTADDVGLAAPDVPACEWAGFLAALVAAGLLVAEEDGTYRGRPDLPIVRHEAGYVAWAMNANRPYVANAPEFLRDRDGAGAKYARDGRWVAVSSRWVGTRGFYPPAFAEIVADHPTRVVDLGSGTCGLLANLLRQRTDCTGLGIDLSPAACAEATRLAARAGLSERLDVLNRPIQSLVDDPSPLAAADVVHAGFVMHDIATEPDVLDGVLRACRAELRERGGKMVVVDAVPFATEPRERAFSALFTYLHAQSMGVRLPTREQWESAFHRAGFASVRCTALRMPGSRMFVVSG
ncbi:class I SAM-dependent methyltransferase [Embleya hyalina]|uniref:Methyltransferase type 12 n=1 Tax=Embleya hyalina TaxID=516124 RepID=A0A401Z1N2_9ACTN|nr:class I SAM-dependent methyltransferase [Embleya hyalina]GCE00795.1 methyltransferase type 12 [Embleya hyalina]